MLKRDDLVKQFELVVKQEIVNHNDQIYQSNQSINSLRNKLFELEKSISILQAKEGSIHQKLSSEILQNFKDLKLMIGEQSRKSFSIESDLKNKTEDIKNLNKLIQICFDVNADHYKSFGEMQKKLNNLSEEIKYLDLELNNCKNSVLKKSFQYSDKIKQEIESKESEAQKVKDELKAQMDIDRVDFNSVMKEILLIKKQSFIQEKKIENLYTTIDRLKMGCRCHKQE